MSDWNTAEHHVSDYANEPKVKIVWDFGGREVSVSGVWCRRQGEWAQSREEQPSPLYPNKHLGEIGKRITPREQ